jgi:hypothetical protein
MAKYSIKEAVEKRLKDFVSYVFAILAAFSINRAVHVYITTPTQIIYSAVGITFLSLAVLITVTVLDPSDNELP